MSELVKLQSTCAHCGQSNEITVEIGITKAGRRSKEIEWYETLAPQEKAVVDAAERTGLTGALADASKAVLGQPVQNVRRYVLTFFASACPFNASPASLLALRQHYRSTNVEIFQMNRIACIYVDGTVRLFIPTAILKPTNMAASPDGKIQAQKLCEAVGGVQSWLKTKMGYVPSDAQEFAKQLRKRSYGEFSDVGL